MFARIARVVVVVVLSVFTCFVLLGAFGKTSNDVSIFEADMWLSPSLKGETRVDIPPFGEVSFNTHAGVFSVNAELTRLKSTEFKQVVDNPQQLREIKTQAEEDVKAAITGLTHRVGWLTAAGFVLAGAVSLLIFGLKRWRTVLLGVGVSVVMFGTVFAVAAMSYNQSAFKEPRYTGLISTAPELMAKAEAALTDFDNYSGHMQSQVVNLTQLYKAAGNLPRGGDPDSVKVLHVSDIHFSHYLQVFELMRKTAEQYDVDMVVDTGDITLGGDVENQLLGGIQNFDVPYVYVKGNHDSEATVKAIEQFDNAVVLDYEAKTIAGLTIAGAPDPRFTGIKVKRTKQEKDLLYQDAGEKLLEAMRQSDVDVAAVHNPDMAIPLWGEVPVILAGHMHTRAVTEHEGTKLFVQGSTGGGGIRGVDPALPIEMTVMEFDRETGELKAYDDIKIGGLSGASAEIKRHVIEEDSETADNQEGSD